MKTSDVGVNLIEEFEGFKSKAYRCPAGIWTVGYGTTFIDGDPVQPGMTVTLAEAESLIKKDLEQFEKAVSDAVRVPLNQNQFDALVSLCYNIGPGGFRRSSVLSNLNLGNYDKAASSIMNFVKGGGKVLPGLVRRRQAEKDLFEKAV